MSGPGPGPLVLTDIRAGRDVVVKLTGAAAASKFAGKIRAFIEEYLVAEHPYGVVFGGRNEEFALLDRWLDDPAAAPRFLLTAPAGRGKSATLVHWMSRRWQAPSSTDAQALVFVPISIRFRTNRPDVYFEAIAARLAEIVGADLRPPQSDPVAYYEDQCRQLLDEVIKRGSRVLIVIDGIDEALGERFRANWFPRRPGPSLRLVLSARLLVGDGDAWGWVERLGWRSGIRVQMRDLPLLPPASVGQMLAETGLGSAGTFPPGFDGALHAVSEGEPLVLKLLVEDLRERMMAGERVNAADLAAIRPGIAGYFQDWLDRQRDVWSAERQSGSAFEEAALLTYLAVLACAYGPLLPDELNEVAAHMQAIPRTFRTEDALAPLRRFVIGAGRASGGGRPGFVLAHPRFADFLREEYFDSDVVDRARAAFAEWGVAILGTLNDQTAPARPPPAYAVEYLAHHLEDAQASLAVMMGMVEEPWLRAWEHLEGGYRGFAQDVARARDAVARRGKSPDPFKAWQVRCQLVTSSIASSGARVSPELLLRCVAENMVPLREALHWAEFQEPPARLRTLAGLAVHAAGAEQFAVFRGVLDAAALVLARDGRLNQACTAAFSRILGDLPDALVRSAFDLLTPRYFYGDETTSELRRALAADLSIAGLRHACTQLLFPDPILAGEHVLMTLNAGLIYAVAPELSPAGVAIAEAAICQSTQEFGRALVLAMLAARPSTVPSSVRQGRALAAIAAAMDADGPKGALLAILIPVLDREGLVEAINLAGRFTRESAVDQAFRALVPHLDGVLAARAISKLTDEYGPNAHSAVKIALASRLPELEFRASLNSVLEGLTYPSLRARILADSISYLPEAEREATIRDAFTIARPERRAETLAVLASYVPATARAPLVLAAIEAAQAVNDPWARWNCVVMLAIHGLATPDLLSAALDAVAAQPNHALRAEGLVALAPYLSGPQAASAFDISVALNDAMWRVDVAAALARRLPPACVARALEQGERIAGVERLDIWIAHFAPVLTPSQLTTALGMTSRITDATKRLFAFAVLADHLPRPQLADALAASRGINDAADRALLLAALAQRMPAEASTLMQEAWLAFGAITDASARCQAVCALGPHLPRPLCRKLLESLDTECDIADRAAAVGVLADVLGADALRDTLRRGVDDACAIADDSRRAAALLSLLPHLDAENRPRGLTETYAAIRQVGAIETRLSLLARLLLHVPSEGLAAPSGMHERGDPVAYITPNQLLATAVTLADTIEWDDFRATAIAQLWPFLPGAERARRYPEIVEAGLSPATAAILTFDDRERLTREAIANLAITHDSLPRLAELVPLLSPTFGDEVLSQLIEASGTNRGQQLRLLRSLLPAIEARDGYAGLAEIARAVRDTACWFR